MEITQNQFPSEVIGVLQDVADAHFIAFDLEFSGISGHSQQRTPGKPRLQDLYEETKVAATKYQILQVGLTVVKEDLENGQYIVKPYNFNISPVPTLRERQFSRDWSMNSGAVQFLLKNNFDFGTPLVSGIPYLSRIEEEQVRMRMKAENERNMPNMELKPEDDTLIKHIRTSIAGWQDQSDNVRERYLNIPNDDRGKGVPGALNRYQMRLTFQVIHNEFPHLKTYSMKDFVQVTNPTAEERERQRTAQKEQIDREVGRAVGFRWILEAITGRDISGMPDECFLAVSSQFGETRSDLTPFRSFVLNLNEKLARRRKVLIGHNCMTDLIFLHQFFLGTLPDRLEDFKASIHELFPAVVDTKNIASFGNGRWGDTSLEAVEYDLRDESEPKIVIPPGFDRYARDERPHEAGYDALLTAKIAIKLAAKMEREAIYYDEKAKTPGTKVAQAQTSPIHFGAREDESITASEDIGHQISASPTTFSKTPSNNITTTTTESQPQSPQSPSKPYTPTPATLIAIKERKSKPTHHHHNSHHRTSSSLTSADLDKVRSRSTFAAPNIYDILDRDLDQDTVSQTSAEDLISFSDADPNSPNRTRKVVPVSAEEEKRKRIEEMVRLGKIMPRWDGGHGFWAMFGNRLQVNSSREGVLELSGGRGK